MKFKIIEETNLGNKIFSVKIHLFPDNMTDSISIRNMELGNADDNERVTIENFLNFTLSQKQYSPIDFIEQSGEIFTVKAIKN